ncbi:MAG TPA: argininosuccinate synthase domain-containing protein, partial [bacterium]|nr:argininosuccinate synthase domain-containing protein [bacterium]
MKKFLVAYSGGVDTTCAIIWLRKKYRADVIAYCSDVGQLQNEKEKREIRNRALKAGAGKVIFEDLRKEFLEEFCFPALLAGA